MTVRKRSAAEPVGEEVVEHAAVLAAEHRVLGAALGDLRHVVREQALEERLGVRAARLDLAHVRDVEDARAACARPRAPGGCPRTAPASPSRRTARAAPRPPRGGRRAACGAASRRRAASGPRGYCRNGLGVARPGRPNAAAHDALVPAASVTTIFSLALHPAAALQRAPERRGSPARRSANDSSYSSFPLTCARIRLNGSCRPSRRSPGPVPPARRPHSTRRSGSRCAEDAGPERLDRDPRRRLVACRIATPASEPGGCGGGDQAAGD